MGKTGVQGYALLRGKTAHRIAYERVHGKVPKYIHIHHICQQPSCVNPDHLQAVTASEHSRLHWADPEYRRRSRIKPPRKTKTRINETRASIAASIEQRRLTQLAQEEIEDEQITHRTWLW
jgi:hypothetical protein